MKRILSFLLVLAMMVSLVAVMTSCGEPTPDPVKTTVTAEEFEAAMEVGNAFTMTLTVAVPGEGSMTSIAKVNGDKIEATMKTVDADGEEESMTMLYETVDGTMYMYMANEDGEGNVSYIKMEYPEEAADLIGDMMSSALPGDTMDFSKYTYDEASKTYKAASLTAEMGGEDIELIDVELSFKDGKLVSFSYKADVDEEEDIITYTCTIDHKAPTVTIPTENVTDMTEMG